MRSMIFAGVTVLMLFTFIGIGLAACGVCGGSKKETGIFKKIREKAELKDGVKQITYEQFMEIRNSGEEYILLDVLSEESYGSGHIPGAQNFAYSEINAETASEKMDKDSQIIVYCGGFLCSASTEAARKLTELGYDVVDYKGGLEEWKAKGNKLVK